MVIGQRELIESVAVLMLAVFVSAGCGGGDERPSASIQGTVMLDGEPLSVGSVQFTSTKTGESAYANLDDTGRYLVKFPEADIGTEYQVTVGKPVEENVDANELAMNPPEPVKIRIPQRYWNRATSGLTTTISSAGENTFNIDLRSR